MNQSEEIEVMHQENARLEANEARSVTEIESLTNEIERLKEENGRYKRAYDQQYKQLMRLLEDQMLLVKKFGDDQGAVYFDDRFIARHKAEQEVIADVGAFLDDLSSRHFELAVSYENFKCPFTRKLAEDYDALRALDTVGLGPHAPNQEADNG